MIELLIGHLIGDFLLQSKTMAIGKGSNSALCAKHCAIYTASMAPFIAYLMFLYDWNIPSLFYLVVLFFGIYLPHFAIDRWSLASEWLDFIEGQTFESAADKYIRTLFSVRNFEDQAITDNCRSSFDIAFTAIVYTVTDFTFHLVCLWVTYEVLWRTL